MSQTIFQAVVGPTAVGKSDYALELAAGLLVDGSAGIDIISVDSKQVYKGLEMITGADVPSGYIIPSLANIPAAYQDLPPFFSNQNQSIFLHGISIIEPSGEWSVAHFQQCALQVIKSAHDARRTVLFVGGTGLYYAHLFSHDERLRVKPNAELRTELELLNLSELQAKAEQQSPEAFLALNNSDKHNPRRLVRILEKAAKGMSDRAEHAPQKSQMTLKYMGLTDSLEHLENKIRLRVKKRLEMGVLKEVTELRAHTPPATPQALATLGVPELSLYLDGDISLEECATLWALHEFQYAKRQLTWWKKQPVEWVGGTRE